MEGRITLHICTTKIYANLLSTYKLIKIIKLTY